MLPAAISAATVTTTRRNAPPLFVYQRIDGPPLCRTYGSNSELILDKATSLDDLGEPFGHEFFEAELRYLVEHEWVRSLDDAIWRRTKQGMWLNDEQQASIRRVAGAARGKV